MLVASQVIDSATQVQTLDKAVFSFVLILLEKAWTYQNHG